MFFLKSLSDFYTTVYSYYLIMFFVTVKQYIRMATKDFYLMLVQKPGF